MSTISNDFARFTIVNIDPGAPSRGPFIVTQQGTDPSDTRVLTRTFLLSRSGEWVDWSSVFAAPADVADDLLFDTVQEMLRVIEALAGKAKIRHLTADPKLALAKIEEIEAAGGLRVAIRYLLDNRKAQVLPTNSTLS